MDILTEQQIDDELARLPGWEYDGEMITKSYELASFREAIAFVDDIADIAEDNNHHPDLEIYFNEVVVSFRTHSENAVTSADIEMAGEVEDLAEDAGYVDAEDYDEVDDDYDGFDEYEYDDDE